MPRGPYQGTYQSGFRPTVVTAPDSLVLVNGESDLTGCPKCKRKFDLSNYITSIQTDLNIDSVPGSATISLSLPRHAIDDFYFDGNLIISPMMEIEIFGKGFFLVEGMPQYYPMFWGLITEVSESYSGGEHTVTINCADILKWWELCRMNIHPAYTAPSGQLGKSIFGNVLFGMNPYDVIYTMAQMAFGDVVIGTGSLTSVLQEAGQTSTFNFALSDIMLYWADRFTRIRNNLLLYGTAGTSVRGDVIYSQYKASGKGQKGPFASKAVRMANGGDQSQQMVFDPSDSNVVAFRTDFTQAGSINLWQSEFQTKLEIANAAKESIGFEFFMDVTGDIVFKPPFYNLDILSNKPTSWIQDIDIIDSSFSESEAEVVTQLQIQGSFKGNIDYGMSDDVTPHTSVTDYHLLRKYGWRPHQISSEFLGEDNKLMFYYGLDVLDRLNARRHRASITIPFRPELRLGFPVYIPYKDQIWYVTGISHSVQFGGRATTTLTCTAKRQKFIAPQGIGSLTLTKPNAPDSGANINPFELSKNGAFELDVGGAAQIPVTGPATDPSIYEPLLLRHPKTGKLCGYPNVTMVYSRPFSPTPETLAGIKKPGKNARVDPQKQEEYKKRAQNALGTLISSTGGADDETALREKYHNNRYSYGLTSAGAFFYAYEKKRAITQLVVLPAKNITVKGDSATASQVKFTNHSALIRPVSDERGFEVIGHFRYGRGVSLLDGSLVPNGPRAKTSFQFALSGDLFEMLNAQSQGLTTISTSYPDPASAAATLAPDGSDLQTAGVQQPNQPAKLVNPGTTFVSTAPMGSNQQKGVQPSVEATQLSRALTLTEMGVRSDAITANDSCDCLLSRADLAFFNVGYQVKTLNPSTPATDSLFGQTGPNAEIPQPVKSTVLSFDQVKSTIETYLFNLYAALDAPHNQYEKSLRGVLTDTGPDTPLDLFAPPTQELGNFAPPFSSINRAALGDPTAIALQGQSALQDLEGNFNQFGQNLNNSIKVTELSQAILQNQKKLASLQSDLQRLEGIKSSGGAISGNIDQEIANRQSQIADTGQKIANDQLELSLLEQQSAQTPPLPSR